MMEHAFFDIATSSSTICVAQDSDAEMRATCVEAAVWYLRKYIYIYIRTEKQKSRFLGSPGRCPRASCVFGGLVCFFTANFGSPIPGAHEHTHLQTSGAL